MKDPVVINYDELKVNDPAYDRIFEKYGHILFELRNEENKELIRAVSQLEEFDNRAPDISQKQWIEANINPLPSVKPLAVFVFLITQWRPSTIAGNAESPNEGYVYVSISSEGTSSH